MYTIHDLCRISNLSRSTILYYDTLGLLEPAERSASNYRLYSDESIIVLKKICLYREAGVSLKDIGILINVPDNDDKNIGILEKTLSQLNNRVREVQEKQNIIIDMIKTINGRNSIDDAYDEQFHDYLRERISLFAFNVYEYSGNGGKEND